MIKEDQIKLLITNPLLIDIKTVQICVIINWKLVLQSFLFLGKKTKYLQHCCAYATERKEGFHLQLYTYSIMHLFFIPLAHLNTKNWSYHFQKYRLYVVKMRLQNTYIHAHTHTHINPFKNWVLNEIENETSIPEWNLWDFKFITYDARLFHRFRLRINRALTPKKHFINFIDAKDICKH